MPSERELQQEAKAIVIAAFRNGPIEDIHAGRSCPTCEGDPGISRISDDQMRDLMKTATDRIFTILAWREYEPEIYQHFVEFTASMYGYKWDDPKLVNLLS